MDDVTIHIDELVLDGAQSPDIAGLAAALGDRIGVRLAAPVAAQIGRALTGPVPRRIQPEDT
jgi:hypothetical protein